MPSRFFKNTLILCSLSNLLVILSIILLQKNLPPVVPLFYGLPVSKSQLVPSVGLIIPSIISISITLVNFIIVKITKDKFLEKALLGITLACLILSVITTINIFFLVGKL